MKMKTKTKALALSDAAKSVPQVVVVVDCARIILSCRSSKKYVASSKAGSAVQPDGRSSTSHMVMSKPEPNSRQPAARS